MAAITVVLLAATLFVGCSLLTPSAPKLEYNKVSGVVRWNKVLFASGYEIAIVDEESGATVVDTSTSATQYAITDYGTFVVTVTAVSSRGKSEPASITVVRVNTQTDTVVDWTASAAAALEDMPVIPYFQNYYYPGCGAIAVYVNSDSEPTAVAGAVRGDLSAREWRFENGCIVLYESALSALDPGQHEMYYVALADGSVETFRIDRVEKAAATVALFSAPLGGGTEIAVATAPASVTAAGSEAVWTYQDGKVVIDAATFAQYNGDTTVPVELIFEDGSIVRQFVLVSENAAEAISIGGGACLLCYDKTDGGDIVVGLGNTDTRGNAAQDGNYYQVAVDGKLIDVGSSYDDDAKFGADRDVLTIKEEYLLSLERGAHKVEIFTRDGVATAYLYVYARNLMCYDLKLNFDECWPEVVLEYKCDAAAEEYIVCIGDAEYSSKEHPEMFIDGRVILTGKIQKNDSVLIKSIYRDELAVSETVAFTADLDALEKYLDPEKGYTWLGEKVNLYVDSQEELENLAQYMLLYFDELPQKSFPLDVNGQPVDTQMSYLTAYFDFDALGFSQSALLSKINTTAFTSYKEAYKLKAAVMPEDSVEVNSIGVILYSATEPSISPDDRPGFVKYTESENNDFHLTVSSRGSRFDDFPIEERTKTAVVSTSDQLFFAVEQGYKPVPVPGSAAERIYEKALDVCRTYIDDDMTDAEKVHVIYDWMGKNVVYDYSAADEMSGVNVNSDAYNAFYKYNCFFLEGVFDDGVAVCNGIAKAVTLLCGIENITCLKVGGTSRGVKHAWNKVFVDGVWYVVDSTWSNARAVGDTVEMFDHDYLMLSTPEAATNHKEDTEDTLPYYAPDGDHNRFSETYFEYGAYVGNYYISSAEELRRLVNYAKSEGMDEVFVFCSSYDVLAGYADAVGVTLEPCCNGFADSDGDAECDRCGSGDGVAVSVNGV